MSMSIHRRGLVPNRHAVWLVAEYLGFTGTIEQCVVYVEKLSEGAAAINLVQPMVPEVVV
jgi:hypothetical protein